MEGSFTHGYQLDLSEFANSNVQREDYIADKDAGFFAVAFFIIIIEAYRIATIYSKKAVSYVQNSAFAKLRPRRS